MSNNKCQNCNDLWLQKDMLVIQYSNASDKIEKLETQNKILLNAIEEIRNTRNIKVKNNNFVNVAGEALKAIKELK